MAVAQGVAFFVAHSFEELVDPDGGVDGETFLCEGWERCGPSSRRDHGPETSDTHGGGVSMSKVEGQGMQSNACRDCRDISIEAGSTTIKARIENGLEA